jgi:hypothetical protein
MRFCLKRHIHLYWKISSCDDRLKKIATRLFASALTISVIRFSFISKDFKNSGGRRSGGEYRSEYFRDHYSRNFKSLVRSVCWEFVSEQDIQNCFKQIDDEVLKQFKIVYTRRLKGQKFIGFWSSKRNVLISKSGIGKYLGVQSK